MKHIIAISLVLILLLPYTAFAATTPTTSFKPNKSSGYAPLKVTFTYTGGSTKLVKSHVWNYGDGHTCKTCWHPSNTFTKPGKYKVSLTIKTAKGTSTKYTYITVKKR